MNNNEASRKRKGKEANGFASVGHTETRRRKQDTGLGDRIGNKSERRVGSGCYIHGGSSNEKLEVTRPLQATHSTGVRAEQRTGPQLVTRGARGGQGGSREGSGSPEYMSKLTNLTLAFPRHGSLSHLKGARNQ